MSQERLWSGYKVYYYDEDNRRNYFKEFVDNNPDAVKSLARFMSLMTSINSGQGIYREQLSNNELKKIMSSEPIWEYRLKDSQSNRQIRIYLGILSTVKVIVILHIHFKNNSKDQKREIKTAEQRFKRFETECMNMKWEVRK